MGLAPESFRTQITAAKQRIQKLRVEERKIRDEIADLRNLIKANINFLPEPEKTAQSFLFELFQQPSNIGEAVRAILMIFSFAMKQGIKGSDIKSAAEYMFGFDFSEYTNPAASITTVLRRLREANQVTYDEATDIYIMKETGAVPEVLNPEMMERVAKQAIAEVRNQMGKEKMDELMYRYGHEESERLIAAHSKPKHDE